MNPQTPGVYIDEVNAFPNSIPEVATAIPAFVGYTPQASYEGKSYFNKTVKITSFQEFKAFFMLPDSPPPASPARQYAPQYYLVKQTKQPINGKYYNFNGEIYTLEPDASTIYYLYNSIRLFYENGGATAYIVSVGSYGPGSGNSIDPGENVVNPNVKLNELRKGIALLKNIEEVTMYVVPEATLLPPADNNTLMEEMLLQCGDMGTAVSIFDIIGGSDPDPATYTKDIENFRNNTGNNFLSYGTAYYPFLNTTITDTDELDYRNLNNGDTAILKEVLAANTAAKQILDEIDKGNPEHNPQQLNQALINASSCYSKIMNSLLERVNILPPSGAMAGIYTQIDNTRGVWNAPANVTPIGVTDVTLKVNDSMQAGLNVDAVSGKSVNAIRFFNGQGILVWGARTLDGNSQDWRYISVRRTVTMIEQSIKLAARAYVFAPNDANTWASVKSMIESFLTNVWKEGGLQGAKATDAFSVAIGLGSTMTAQDILNGIMRISVKLAVVSPVEFIVIEIEQEMAKE